MQIDFFGATWCPSCKGQLALWQAYAGKYGHTVNYIDVDECPEDAGENAVTGLPTVILPDGSRYAGSKDRNTIEKACNV